MVTDCLTVESLLGEFCLQLLIAAFISGGLISLSLPGGCRFNNTGASPERIVPCPIFRINYNGDLRTALGSSPFSGTQCVTGLALSFSSSFPACPFSHVRGSSLAVLIKTAQVKGGCCSKETELYICCPWRAVCSGEG